MRGEHDTSSDGFFFLTLLFFFLVFTTRKQEQWRSGARQCAIQSVKKTKYDHSYIPQKSESVQKIQEDMTGQ